MQSSSSQQEGQKPNVNKPEELKNTYLFVSFFSVGQVHHLYLVF